MDWKELQKELSNEGFFSLYGETPQSNITNDEIAQYAKNAGLMSFEDLQKAKEAQSYETQRAKVLELIKGKTHLSFSTLTRINEIRYPRNDAYSSPQGRFNIGKFYESQLTGEPFDGTTPSKAEREMVATMVANARKNDTLEDWLLSECVHKQYHAVGSIKGLRFHGYLDYFSDCEPTFRMGAENKTTKERTLAGFLKSCATWHYHGQVYGYKELLNLQSFTTFASSKTNGKLLQLDYTPELFAEGEAQFDSLVSNLEYYDIAKHFRV